MFKVVCCRIVIWGKGLFHIACQAEWHSGIISMYSFHLFVTCWYWLLLVVGRRPLFFFKHIQMLYDTCSRRLWKSCGNMRNCSWWAIFPFVTMFLICLINVLSFIESPYFWRNSFKIVCCIWGKMCRKCRVDKI